MADSEYTIKYNARSRSIRVRVERDGKVLVTAHPLTPVKIIDAFVADNEEWIAKQKSHFKPVVSRNAVKYRGREMPIEWWPNESADKIEFVQPSLVIYTKGADSADFEKLLEKWLLKEAKRYLPKRVEDMAMLFDLEIGKISVRRQKSRWGSCNRQGDISLNFRLVQFADDIIDCVIAHELAHTKHMNHSRDFWDEVGAMYPEYKKCRKQLRHDAMDI